MLPCDGRGRGREKEALSVGDPDVGIGCIRLGAGCFLVAWVVHETITYTSIETE